MLKYRLFNPNVSLLQRGLQVTNAFLEVSLGKSWHLAHVLEFPKCGGSWVRNMIRTYRGTELFTYNRIIGKSEVVMAHRLYHRRFSHPIVVVRDPRDMYVSFYYYETVSEHSDSNSLLFRYFQHDPDRPVQDDFYEYLRIKLLKLTHPWFFYSQFLDSWLNRPDTCVVRYEDCLAEPENQLIRILRFLNDPVDFDKVGRTVEKTCFKSITKTKYGKSRSPGEEDNSRFHRKGISGDWKGHFNEKSCHLLEKMEGASLRRLGYELDSGWIERFTDEGRN